MWQLYLIEQLNNLQNLFIVMVILFSIVCIIFWVFAITDSYVDDDEKKLMIKYGRRYLYFTILSALLLAITPSTSSAYRIFAIGTTLEYLKSNDTAKQIPDKMLKIVDKYLDEFSEDKKEE